MVGNLLFILPNPSIECLNQIYMYLLSGLCSFWLVWSCLDTSFWPLL